MATARKRRQHTPREGASKALRKLGSACEALCWELSKAPPQRRREVIEKLSKGLKSELISIKEAQRNRPSRRCAAKVLGGSVWCVRRAKEGPYHRIRLSLAGVVVTSRRLALKSAQDGLNHLRLAAGGGGPESILRALDVAGSESALGLSYQVVLDARGTIGRRLHSRSLSLDEAIHLRRQVAELTPIEVAHTGLRWAQESRHVKGRRWCWSKQKADGVWAKLRQRLDAMPSKRLEKKAQQAERAMAEVRKVSAARARSWLTLSEASARGLSIDGKA